MENVSGSIAVSASECLTSDISDLASSTAVELSAEPSNHLPDLSAESDATPNPGPSSTDVSGSEVVEDSFEETMAMLRDLTGNKGCKPVVSCISLEISDKCATVEIPVTQVTNDISVESAMLGTSSSDVTAIKTTAEAPKLTNIGSSLNAMKRSKGTSSVFDRCIETLRQRGMGLDNVSRDTKSPSLSTGSNSSSHQPQGSVSAAAMDSTCPDFACGISADSLIGRSHRKSRKPTKVSHANISEEVEIGVATRPLQVACDQCSFTCNTTSDLVLHTSTVHTDSSGQCSESRQLFTCKYCKMSADSKAAIRSHLAHHTGSHVFRCFSCPYCSINSDNMDAMDDHIASAHPTQDFRFEVAQEKVNYMQDMFECPVCSGAFPWQSDFVFHLRSSHKLEELATHLEKNFVEIPVPSSLRIARLLLEGFGDNVTDSSVVTNDVLMSGEGASDVEVSRDLDSSELLNSGMHIPLHCDDCDFSTESWETLDEHIQEQHRSLDHSLTGLIPGSPSDCLSGQDGHLGDVTDDLSYESWENFSDAIPKDECPDALLMPPDDSIPSDSKDLLGIPDDMSEYMDSAMTVGIGKRKHLSLKCKLCPFECNRTPNFRRHLMIHRKQAEYGEGYRCAYCKFQHRRLNCIRFHHGKYHGEHPPRLSRVVGGSVVEVIDADDTRLGRSSAFPEIASTSEMGRCSAGCLSLKTPDMENFLGEGNTGCSAGAADSLSPPVPVMSREKRLSKPPKRLSESSDFLSPLVTSWRIRRSSTGHSENISHSHAIHQNIPKIPSSGFELPSLESLPIPSTRGMGGRPFDEHIAEDYLNSDLPPGMIYHNPVKCPRCDFTNRVRINLVRHMKQHHTEDLQEDQINSDLEHHTSPGRSNTPSHISYNSLSGKPSSSSVLSEFSDRHSPAVPASQTCNAAVKNEPAEPLYDAPNKSLVHALLENRLGPKLAEKPMPPLRAAPGAFLDSSRQRAWSLNRSLDRNGEHSTGRSAVSNWNRVNLSGGTVEEVHIGGLGMDHLEGSSSGMKLPLTTSSVGFDQVGYDSILECRDLTGGGQSKRLFKCAYCSVSSRWNRRDISLHVLHVHVRRRAFRCRRCGYGTSRSAATVRIHCARTHPGRPAILEDNLTILNAILPLHARPGIVPVAFRRPNGTPILSIDELEKYFGLSQPAPVDYTLPSKSVENFPACSAKRNNDVLQNTTVPASPLDLSSSIPKGVEGVRPDFSSLQNPAGPIPGPRKQTPSPQKLLLGSKERLSVRDQDGFAHFKLHKASNANNFESKSPPVSDQKSPGSAAVPKTKSTGKSGSSPGAFYRCKLCGYQDARHDKTKYHVVREHLHLGPYGCAYCPRYMWGRRHVARHIAAVHPGYDVQIRRAFDEFESYLRANIRKIGGMPERLRLNSSKLLAGSLAAIRGFDQPSDAKSLGDIQTVNEASLSREAAVATLQPTPQQRKPFFQCGYCEFHDVLAARVQGHCLTKHPEKPIRCRKIEREDEGSASSAAAAVDVDSGLKIHSVESLSMRKRGSTPTVHTRFGSPRDPVHDDFQDGDEGLKFNLPDPPSWNERDSPFQADNSRHNSSWNPDDSNPIPASNAGVKQEYLDLNNDGSSAEDMEENEGLDRSGSYGDSFPSYVCRYCPEMAWSEVEMRAHLVSSHPTEPAQFGLVVPDADRNDSSAGLDADSVQNEENGETSLANGGYGRTLDTGSKSNPASNFIYRCKLCQYRSDKVTVVRHHVMAHLLYHPYRCPYCDAARSVKSSPITKHIRVRHPGCRQNFVYLRDDDLERQVRLNYYRTESKGMEDNLPQPPPISRRNLHVNNTRLESTPTTTPTPAPRANPVPIPMEEKEVPIRRSGRRVLYKCKFCKLKTYVRTDMRHHLMREIGYKPFRCGHCGSGGGNGYAEPSRSAMGKHFRMRHAGMTVEIHDLSEPERDAEVLKILDSCMVEDGSEKTVSQVEELPPLLKPAPGYGSGGSAKVPRSAPSKPPVLSRLPVVKMESNVDSRDNNSKKGALTLSLPKPKQLQQQPQQQQQQQQPKRGKVSAMRLRRCRHCAYSSPSAKALVQHVAVRHRPRSLRCAYCPHMTHYPSWLRKHARKSHPDLPFKFEKVPSREGSVEASPASDGNPDQLEMYEETDETNPQLDEQESSDQEGEEEEEENEDENDMPPALDSPDGPATDTEAGNTSDGADDDEPEEETTVSILDGVPIRIPLAADSHGLFHCPDCTYQSTNRAHFRMHCMIHRPRKWQCCYCRLKFPLLFRLRHHHVTKHFNKPLKWIDLTTNQVCDEATRASASSTSHSLLSSRKSPALVRSTARKSSFTSHGIFPAKMSVLPNQKSTARKSTSRSALRVAMFRCGQYFSIRSCSALEKSSSFHSKSDNEDFDDSESLLSSSSAGENAPSSSSSYPKKFCCHLCPLICGYLDDFSRHLQREHLPKPVACSPSPTIEILRNVVDDIAIVPQQCGFCPYETMDRGNFSGHLRTAHGLDAPPLVCCTCRLFASFAEVSMGRHYIAVHPGLPCRFETLALPFTMTRREKDGAGLVSADTSRAPFYMLPNVQLVDVMKIPLLKLDKLLTENCVLFIR